MTPQDRPTRLRSPQGVLGAAGDQCPLFLAQGRVDVEHEGIYVSAQLGDDERHPVDHQPGDEMHVTPEPAELGDEYRALEPLCFSKGSLELRSALKRVMALAGLYLDIARGDGEAVSS